MNRGITEWVNGWPEAFEPVMRFMSEGTNYGWVKIALVLFILGCIAWGGKVRAAAIFAVLAFLLANETTDIIKDILPATRPCQELALDLHGIGCSDNPGTASAHSANMAAVALAFTYFLGWHGAIWVLVALLTGLSRIYVGAHYPCQVLLGWTVGAFAALLLIKTWEAWRKYRRSEGRRLGDQDAAV